MRTVVNWMGGKTRQLNNLLPLFDQIEHSIYVESFGGAGTVLLAKNPVKREIYNDLNGLLCNLFRELRKPTTVEIFEELSQKFPYSREFNRELREICIAYYYDNIDECKRLIEQAYLSQYDFNTILAWCFFYVQNSSYGGVFLGSYGISGGTRRSMSLSLFQKIANLPYWSRRFRLVEVEHLNGIDCIQKYDSPNTLHYVDPPYERNCSAQYRCHWTKQKTQELVAALKKCRGSVVLSCYDSQSYEGLLETGYQKKDFSAYSSIGNINKQYCTETIYYRISNKVNQDATSLESCENRLFG